MSAHNAPHFRIAVLGGYNTSDVISYIAEEDRRTEGERKRLLTRIDELTEHLGESETAREAAEARLAELTDGQSESAALLRRAEEAEETLRIKESVMEGMLAEIADLKRTLAETNEKYGELSRSCAELERDKQYLVDLEIAARRRADDLEQATTARVEEISTTVRERVGSAAGLLSSFSEDANRKMGEAMEKLNEYTELLRTLGVSFEETRTAVLAEVEVLGRAALPATEETNAEAD